MVTNSVVIELSEYQLDHQVLQKYTLKVIFIRILLYNIHNPKTRVRSIQQSVLVHLSRL
jgi:hypothetical protein